MKEKLYFELGAEERCYPIEYFEDRINDGEKEIILEVAKREFGSGVMWCKIQSEFVARGDDTCGSHCDDYKPRNKKSGRCKHLDNTFIGTGTELILAKGGLKKHKVVSP